MGTTLDYSRLKGRILWAYVDGWRALRLTAVSAGKRIGLRHLRGVTSSYEPSGRFAWHGRKYTIDARAAREPGAGIVYRRRIVPVDEFAQRKAMTYLTHHT